MSSFHPRDLAALGLSPDMLGPAERLPLPTPAVDEARGYTQVQTSTLELLSASSPYANSSNADPLDARSDVLGSLSVRLQIDAELDALIFDAPAPQDVQVRPAHPGSPPVAPDAQGRTRVLLRQAGRFLIENRRGVPLALGQVDHGVLTLALVGAWPPAPLHEWMARMNDAWLQSLLAQTIPAADPWTRTTVAGQVARLTVEGVVDAAVTAAAAGGPGAWLAALSSSPAMQPRLWVRTLDARALDALEEHARRRAVALIDDLHELLDTVADDAMSARWAWPRLCHRRDDLEGVRLLLREAGAGGALDDLLAASDRAGRMVRLSFAPEAASDERLRRVALADPGAWWGDAYYEARLV